MAIVLFVDDDIAVLEGLRRSTRREPYEVRTAASAAEALLAVACGEVDVIVTDQRMPGMSGSELLDKVRAAYPEIVQIMLTGETGLHSTVRVLSDAPLYRFLSKPVGPEELRRTLLQAIHMKEVADRARALRRTVRAGGRAKA